MTTQIRLAQPVGNEQDESNFMPVGNINLGHPVLNVFAAEDADYFSTVKFYRYFPIELPQEQPKDQAEPADAAGKPDTDTCRNTTRRRQGNSGGFFRHR